MAAAVFTSWSALYVSMQNAMAEFVANRMQVAEYDIVTGGTTRRFKYRSFKELQDGLAYIKPLADAESVAEAPVGRTYAKNGGRG